jgi:hypothetical protein
MFIGALQATWTSPIYKSRFSRTIVKWQSHPPYSMDNTGSLATTAPDVGTQVNTHCKLHSMCYGLLSPMSTQVSCTCSIVFWQCQLQRCSQKCHLYVASSIQCIVELNCHTRPEICINVVGALSTTAVYCQELSSNSASISPPVEELSIIVIHFQKVYPCARWLLSIVVRGLSTFVTHSFHCIPPFGRTIVK